MSKSTAARPSGQVHGVLIVDKPSSMTSFDVVAQVRRVFGTRRVGHAGTLDPMATGVLVLLLGEGTKLSNVLSTDKKSYRTEVSLGTSTDTLDRDGTVNRRGPLPVGLNRERVELALDIERARRDQIPPQVSAIKVDGKRAYAQARKGIEVDLLPRHVRVHELMLDDVSDHVIRLSMTVSKGYYVRSLGRDLAASLGTVGHLSALRRTKSGPFSEDEAHPLPLSEQTPLMSIEEAALRCLNVVHITEQGAIDVQQGRRLSPDHVIETSTGDFTSDEHYAAFFRGKMLALLSPLPSGEYKVRRGLSTAAPTSQGDQAENS